MMTWLHGMLVAADGRLMASTKHLLKMTAGWLIDKELALSMLHWIMAFAVAGRDQLRHTHVGLLSNSSCQAALLPP